VWASDDPVEDPYKPGLAFFFGAVNHSSPIVSALEIVNHYPWLGVEAARKKTRESQSGA
jgi:hypothetical protein